MFGTGCESLGWFWVLAKPTHIKAEQAGRHNLLRRCSIHSYWTAVSLPRSIAEFSGFLSNMQACALHLGIESGQEAQKIGWSHCCQGLRGLANGTITRANQSVHFAADWSWRKHCLGSSCKQENTVKLLSKSDSVGSFERWA